MLLVTQHTLPHRHAGYTQHVITNSTHTHNTCTEHKRYALAITTSDPAAHFQWAAVGGVKWRVDVNPVSSEQHMRYIHLVIKELLCSGECFHRSLCHNHLMHVPFALGLQPTHLLRWLLLPVWEDCLLSVAMSKLLYIYIHLLLNYTQNVGSPYTRSNTERSFLGKLLCCYNP